MNKSAETQKPGSSGLGGAALRDSACVCLAVSS